MVHHVSVSRHHAAGSIVFLLQKHAVAGVQDPVITGPLLRAPALRLAAEGDGGTETHILVNLTQEERSGLERALEIRLYGREACEANEQVDTFLHNRLRHEPGWPILDLLTGAEETMLERYARLHDLRITVLGCGLIPIYEALSELIDETGTLLGFTPVDAVIRLHIAPQSGMYP